MKVNVIRHLAFEDLGSFATLLDEKAATIRYFEAGVDDLAAIDTAAEDLLVVLGGPISVNDEAEYPFLKDEIGLLKSRLDADLPTLGICLGAQLMAKALGANVYGGAQKEIGWFGLRVNEQGRQFGLQWLDEANTQMLHWHGETFDIPAGAVRLASSGRFENQAFAVGKHCLALQFHPEVTASGLERWYIGHTGEIHATEGVSVAGLRADSEKYAMTLQAGAARFFDSMLNRMEAGQMLRNSLK